ncbi:MAG: putative metal-dependent peptidase [Acidimicrobiales bacterium]
MSPLDQHQVVAARLWAAHQFPYLASALFALSVDPVEDLGSVMIDEWWRVHVDPEIADGLSVEQLGGELVHLTTHVLRDHAGRARAVGFCEPAEKHHWVDAADAEVNDDLPPDLPRAREAVDPSDLGCADGRLAEEYYRRGIPREDRESDCGSGAHGDTGAWEQPPPAGGGSGLDRDEQGLVRQRVAADIRSHDDADVPEGLRRWANEQRQPTIDWRRLLAAQIRRSVAFVSGAVDYSYARPSRRAAALGNVVLPSMRRPDVSVAVVCDTSASVDDRLLSDALGEIEGMLQAVGTRQVRVLACDDAVRSVSNVRRVDDIVLFGGGGTDMTTGLEMSDALRPRPQVVVVMTDGFTPWPDQGLQRTQVIVALLESNVDGVRVPEPPSWTTVVRVDSSAV